MNNGPYSEEKYVIITSAKYSLAAIALILSSGAASAAQQCTISDGSRTGTVIANDWVAFFPESESGAVPREDLIKKDRIFRDASWRNKLKTVSAPAGCESVIWTDVSAGGEKMGGPGTFNIPAGKNSVSYMCRCK